MLNSSRAAFESLQCSSCKALGPTLDAFPLQDFPRLYHFMLEYNGHIGGIPAAWATKRGMLGLFLNNNYLTGPLPDWLTSMFVDTPLASPTIDLSFNYFSGALCGVRSGADRPELNAGASMCWRPAMERAHVRTGV